jgi:hypothetical protein
MRATNTPTNYQHFSHTRPIAARCELKDGELKTLTDAGLLATHDEIWIVLRHLLDVRPPPNEVIALTYQQKYCQVH